jgi:hypothetical protein
MPQQSGRGKVTEHMRLMGFKFFALLCTLFLASQPAVAQEQEGISFGQLKLLLTAGLTYGHDDNITYANGSQVESDFYVFSPGIRLEAPSDDSIFALTWEGESRRYDSSELDDYDDWGLKGTWDYDPTSRSSLGLFGEIREGHDGRGEGRSLGDEGLEQFDPDEYDLLCYGGYFDYGAVGSRGKLELEASHIEREYTNNRDFTQGLDRQDDHFGAVFLFRIRPKTSLVFEYGKTDFSYDFQQPQVARNDSTETRFYIGVDWDVTARTSGRIEFGVLEKDFDHPGYTDYDDATWKAVIDWTPRTYSTFTLTATRETDEPIGFGQYILREDISLDWTHYWSTRFNTIVEYGVGTDEHQPLFHKDDLTYWGIEARWQLGEHFQLGVGFHDYERDSEVVEFGYDRNVWMLTLEGSL